MKTNKRGFTIIEVVLVLAIAGLIFLAVFIALPALQRSQRNTRRRQDLSRIASAVTEYQAANNKLPFTLNNNSSNNHQMDMQFIPKYVDQKCKTAKATNYDLIDNNPSVTFESCGEQFTSPNGNPYILYYWHDVHKGRSQGKDNSGKPIGSQFVNGIIASKSLPNDVIFASTHAKCGEGLNSDGHPYVIKTSGPNDFALQMRLEGGQVYCVDNS